MNNLIILTLVSFTISLFTVAVVKNYLAKQLMDIPNQRSSHTQPTPRGGGIGFVVAFAITSSLTGNFQWLILLPLVIISLIDDYRDLSAKIRYLVQFITASVAIIVYGYLELPTITNLGVVSQIIGVGITVIAITAMINFYNFMDGLDGLVAGVCAIQLGFLALYLSQPYIWLLVAAILGFLRWNWSPAQIFMGDVGSTFLGAIVAITILQLKTDPVTMWCAFGVTLPLVSDAIYTLARRLIKRENIFQAHRTHIYQRLQKNGWSHSQVVTIYLFLTLIVAIIISLGKITGLGISVVMMISAIVTSEWYLQRLTTFQDQIELN